MSIPSIEGSQNKSTNYLSPLLAAGKEEGRVGPLALKILQNLSVRDCASLALTHNCGISRDAITESRQVLNWPQLQKILEEDPNFSSVTLKKLYLSESDICGGDLKDIVKRFPNLQNLYLRDCKNLMGSDLVHLQGLPLRSLAFERCNLLVDDDLVHLQRLPSLQALFIRELPLILRVTFKITEGLTGAGLVYLQGLPIKSLSLKSCSKLKEENLRHLQALSLTKLFLDDCNGVTGSSFAHLVGLPLNILSLRDCSKFDGQNLEHLQGFPFLYGLDLLNCPRVTSENLGNLSGLPIHTLGIGGGGGGMISRTSPRFSPIAGEEFRCLKELPLSTLLLGGMVCEEDVREIARACPSLKEVRFARGREVNLDQFRDDQNISSKESEEKTF